MINEYRKVPTLPMGVNAQQNILLSGGNATGKNWIIADGGEFCKRPGLRPVLTQPEIEVAYSSALLNPPGILASGEYIAHSQMRSVGIEELNISGTPYYLYGQTQLVYVFNGRLWAIKKIPLLGFNGTLYQCKVGINSATGLTEFSAINLSTLAVTTYTITSTSTIADVAAALPGIVTAATKTNYYASPVPEPADVPAIALEHTDSFESNGTTTSWMFGYVNCEMAISRPNPNLLVNYRIFLNTLRLGQDSNINVFQFQDELILVGRYDAPMSYDGYRVSVAGCIEQWDTPTTTLGVGSLSAGTYNYIVRTKITKPSGQITYGPPVSFSKVVALNDSVRIYLKDANGGGSNYGDAFSLVSPRRYNPLPDSAAGGPGFSTITDIDNWRPQVGEYLSDTQVLSTNFNRHLIEDVTSTEVFTYDTLSGPRYSLGETFEVFRTVVGGTTVYYKTGESPVLDVHTGGYFEDTKSDAALIIEPSYVAKPYIIQRPPDVCIAGCTHQGRIVIVGEYLVRYDDLDGDISVSEPKRPFIKNVYWSQPNNEEFSPTNNVILDVTEGGELNSCISVNDTLYVSGSNSMWTIQGSLASANSYTVNRVAGAAGTVGNTALCALNGQVFGVSKSGLYQLSGGSVDYTIGAPINSLIRQLPSEVLPFIRLVSLRENGGLLLHIPGCSFTKLVNADVGEINIFSEDASEGIALVYDQNTQMWSQWSGGSMYMSGGVVEFDGKLWALPRKAGEPICVFDEAYGNDGFDTPVEMRIEGPWQHDGDIFTDKNFTRLRVIHASPSSQNYVLNTSIERNWVENVATQTFDIDFLSGQGYGEVAYGETPYGEPNETTKQTALTNQKALSVRAVFENSEPTEFPSISGWNFEIGANRTNMKQE
jgi:hypothetical protein